MAFASALILYQNENFVGCTQTALINSNLVDNNPKQAWIYLNKYGYYMLTFADPKDPTALTGVWVSEAGQGMLIDGNLNGTGSVSAALQSCCGSTPVVITPVYNGVFPPLTGRTLAVYTITRVDDGTITDLQDFALAYLDWAQPIPAIQRSSYTSGTSTYVLSSFKDPVLQGNDILVSESARLFLSNAPGALTSGNKFTVTSYINGDLVGTPVKGATDGALSTLPALLAADANYGPLGTWSVVSGAIQLSSTTQDAVNITVTQATT